MAERSVIVRLKAEVADYINGLRRAQAETDKLNADLGDVGDHGGEFAKTGAEADALSAALKETGREADKTGDQMRQAGVDAGFLAAEIAKTRREAEELALALALGDATPDTLSKYQSKRSYLGQLTSVAKNIGLDDSGMVQQAATSGAKTGAAFGGGFAKTFAQYAAGLFTNPITGPALILSAGLIGAELGGAIGGGILVGLGGLAIGGGIAAALQFPEVKAQADELGASLKRIAFDVGSEFRGPTSTAINVLRQEVDHLRPSLVATAHELAPVTTDLAHGWADGLDIFTRHLEAALIKARPLLEWLAQEGPKLGDQFGDLLETIADHSDEAVFALDALFGILKIVIDGLEAATVVGSKFLDVVKFIPEKLGLLQDEQTDKYIGRLSYATDEAGQAASGAATDYDKLVQSLGATKNTSDTVAGAMADKLFDAIMSVDRASLDLAEAQTRLSETVKENGHTIDIHTAKGQANREAVLDVVEANIRAYDTMIRLGASAEDAADAYDQNTAALEKQLRQAHFTDDQINQLIGSYRGVPKQVDTDIQMKGLVDALNNLGLLLAKLNGLDGKDFGFTVTQRNITLGPNPRSVQPRAAGGYWAGRAAASGMYLPPADPGWLLAGEPQTGGEWLVPEQGISRQRAAWLLSSAAAPHGLAVGAPVAAGGWSGVGRLDVRLSWAGGDGPIGSAIMQHLRAEVQDGGGNVQVVIGQGA